MAQRHLESSEPLNGNDVDALGCYLRSRATEFLRSLRQHRESGATGETAEAARALRRAARRISGTLHTFRPLLDTEWSDALRPELAWLSGTLAREHAYASRLDRLTSALHTLTSRGSAPSPAGLFIAPAAIEQARPAGLSGRGGAGEARRPPAPRTDTTAPAPAPTPEPRDTLTLGAAKASALLDRQLTLARTRAHSTALQSLGSARFHAVADNVAVLASDVPLATTATRTELEKLAAEAESRLTEATTALHHTSHPYNADADASWHHVRLLLRLHRYAREVLPDAPRDVRLLEAADALNTHRDAAEAAAAAAHGARTPRIAPTTAYALGVLHADQRHEVAAARLAFGQAWQRQTVGTP
ncbi:CHAD domain-containing protein [Streptomyces sp. NPDC002790]|uniref:CHAD domain-containing protein n=1 Tax=Streptomyces sp. NPDC002790 TaxID=3154431 RepID=UPI00332E78C4